MGAKARLHIADMRLLSIDYEAFQAVVALPQIPGDELRCKSLKDRQDLLRIVVNVAGCAALRALSCTA